MAINYSFNYIKHPLGFYNKKSSNQDQSAYQFTPYSGPTPPAVDSPGQEILRPTQKQIYDILTRRSEGRDVGYNPEMKREAIDLLGSQLDQSQEDQVRAAKGSAAASGLGGNLAAQSALEGKVRRDIGRTYGQGVTEINIEDLARQNQERDINTARLQDFNNSNFGQENNRADFGLKQYATEQGLQQSGDQFNTATALANRAFQDQQQQEFGQFATNAGITALGAYTGNPMLAASGVAGLTGTGIAPQTPGLQNQPSDTISALARAKQKKVNAA